MFSPDAILTGGAGGSAVKSVSEWAGPIRPESAPVRPEDFVRRAAPKLSSGRSMRRPVPREAGGQERPRRFRASGSGRAGSD